MAPPPDLRNHAARDPKIGLGGHGGSGSSSGTLGDGYPSTLGTSNGLIGSRYYGTYYTGYYNRNCYVNGTAVAEQDCFPQTQKSFNSLGLVIGLSVVAGVALLSVLGYCVWRKRNRGKMTGSGGVNRSVGAVGESVQQKKEGDPSNFPTTFAQNFNTKNVDNLLSNYDADSVLDLGGGQVFKGPEQIKAALTNFLSAGLQMETSLVSCTVSGEFAVCLFTWKMEDAMGGSAVDVLRKNKDGHWHQFLDLPFGHAAPKSE
ncbi:hypothetical protein HDU98_006274 [Podochytrium sp. JEL0797]|nr:hypothetical protein HDU98_006274 [Podochytrium sp. JEL0797]